MGTAAVAAHEHFVYVLGGTYQKKIQSGATHYSAHGATYWARFNTASREWEHGIPDSKGFDSTLAFTDPDSNHHMKQGVSFPAAVAHECFIYVIGGHRPEMATLSLTDVYSKHMQRFEPAQVRWELMPEKMKCARAGPAAAEWAGRIFVSGGVGNCPLGSDGSDLVPGDTVEYYIIDQQKWFFLPKKMTHSVAFHAMVALTNPLGALPEEQLSPAGRGKIQCPSSPDTPPCQCFNCDGSRSDLSNTYCPAILSVEGRACFFDKSNDAPSLSCYSSHDHKRCKCSPAGAASMDPQGQSE